MNRYASQRKAIIAGVLAFLSFLVGALPNMNPETASNIDWAVLALSAIGAGLGAYHYVWVAPNEPTTQPSPSVNTNLHGGADGTR